MTMAVGLAAAGFTVVAWVIGFLLLRGLWGLAGHSYDELLASGSKWGLVWPIVPLLMAIGYPAWKHLERAWQRTRWL